MKMVCRLDTPERKHYTAGRKSLVDIRPAFLYSGALSKSQDWRDSRHSHEFLEIILIGDGMGIVEIEDSTFHVKKNEIIIYNANVEHFEHSSPEEPMEAVFIAFDKIQLKDLPPNCILPQGANCIFNADSSAPVLKRLFDLIRDELTGKEEFYAEVVKDASRTILMYIFRIINRTLNSVNLSNKDNILNVVIPYIDKNFLNSISLSDIASECFVDKYYLSHMFTETFGMSVGQYIRAKRVELAQKLIRETNLPISDIAGQCGFADRTCFDRQFKKITGTTPMQYRRANKPQR